MASAQAATAAGPATEPQESAEGAENPPAGEAGGALGNFLAPDVVLVFALAVLIDILDVVLALGVLVNLIMGGPILAWMIWKTGQVQSAKDQIERVRKKDQLRADFRQRQQQQLAARKAATRRAWRRGLLFFLGGLIPILSIFVLWTWAVISTVRGK